MPNSKIIETSRTTDIVKNEDNENVDLTEIQEKNLRQILFFFDPFYP